MAELKLGKLPDRTPVKPTISVRPDLNQDLVDYAKAYRSKCPPMCVGGSLKALRSNRFVPNAKRHIQDSQCEAPRP
jgi:hypothetical protein